MKKILSFFAMLVLIAVLTGGFFIYSRYRQNTEQIVPYPYGFSQPSVALALEAPILIIGDHMGDYFSKFKTELAETISVNLSNPIKIQSIAKDGHALHRTLHELRSLISWPQIMIYQGGSEEFSESKFRPAESRKIKLNFRRFTDDRIQTALILYPWLSRIVYEPVQRIILQTEPKTSAPVTEQEYLDRLETEILLFKQELIELVNLSKDKNSLLVLTTTPINLDVAPRKICHFTSNMDLEKELLGVKASMADDPKSAYAKTTKLIQQYAGNAEIFYLHGQIAKRLGKLLEGKKSILEASAFDCEPWRISEVYNSIIRSVAYDHQVLLFDFALLVDQDWGENPTFFDDLHPQNLYYQRGMKQLGMVIKDILKL